MYATVVTGEAERDAVSLQADLASGDMLCNDKACHGVFVFVFAHQTTEAGRERKALHGAAEEEDGERGSEDDEEGAEDCRQALVTYQECSVLRPMGV